MMNFRFSSPSPTTLTSLCFGLCLAWAAPFAAAAGADTGDAPAPVAHEQAMDHSEHATMDHSVHEMDHSGHEMDHSGQGAGDDPHAHHRAMMNQQGYKRSEHAYRLGEYEVVGMDGEKTTLLDEINCGKPVMVNFIFTTCTTICPVMSATFAQVQSELGAESEDVRMISVSIDPEHDTPERLREYAGRFNAGPQWQFLTGSLASSVAIQKAFDVYRGNKMNHEPTTLMKRADGDTWVRIDGLARAADIVSEYHRLVGR